MDLRTLASVMRGVMAGKEQSRQQQLLDEKLAREKQMQQRQDQEFALRESERPLLEEERKLRMESLRRKNLEEGKQYQAEYQAPVFQPVAPVAESVAKAAPVMLGGMGVPPMDLSAIVKPFAGKVSEVGTPTWKDRTELGMLPFSMEQKEERAQALVDAAQEKGRQFEERMRQIDEDQKRREFATVIQAVKGGVMAPTVTPFGQLNAPPVKAGRSGGSGGGGIGSQDIPDYPKLQQKADWKTWNDPKATPEFRKAAGDRLLNAGLVTQVNPTEFKETAKTGGKTGGARSASPDKYREEARKKLDAGDFGLAESPEAMAAAEEWIRKQMTFMKRGVASGASGGSGLSAAMQRLDSMYQNLLEK